WLAPACGIGTVLRFTSGSCCWLWSPYWLSLSFIWSAIWPAVGQPFPEWVPQLALPPRSFFSLPARSTTDYLVVVSIRSQYGYPFLCSPGKSRSDSSSSLPRGGASWSPG